MPGIPNCVAGTGDLSIFNATLYSTGRPNQLVCKITPLDCLKHLVYHFLRILPHHYKLQFKYSKTPATIEHGKPFFIPSNKWNPICWKLSWHEAGNRATTPAMSTMTLTSDLWATTALSFFYLSFFSRLSLVFPGHCCPMKRACFSHNMLKTMEQAPFPSGDFFRASKDDNHRVASKLWKESWNVAK